ncbi:patatin-like phospholipase family protein [Candidatus Tisiphia endosymbiont of Oplodontha viridula]|uniref:patatin-like phospholipase family protein n=1 Tax=Candidatus Tisiphia endosymbiont of Oplodontha viridula TaxID=3077925 RepID=UPI0035C88958
MATPQNSVLALSGGGIKGIAQLVVLAEIERITGKYIFELFDVIAGTSVGGILAIILTLPKEKGSTKPMFSAVEALKLFEDNAANIFPQKFGGDFLKFFKHKYSQKPLKAMLEKYAGDNTLGDSLSRLFITAFDVSGEADDPNKVFDSFDPVDKDIFMKLAALWTSAAPTYFKAVDDFVDGGLGANRPAASALKKLKEGLNIEQQSEVLKNTTICALNFESPNVREIPSKKLDGQIGWLTKGNLVNKILRANEKDATDEVRRDLQGQFTEIILKLSKECTKLDNVDPSNIAKLKGVGRKYIEDNKESLEKLCTKLVENVAIRENALKAHEEEVSVDQSDVSSESLTSDIENSKDSASVVSNRLISEEFEAKLAINLNEQQVDALKEGLMKLTPKEYEVLQVFLQGLNDAQLVALSKNLPLIADGNFKNTNISEFSNFQNKFLKFFSSMFEHEDNIINDALSCTQQYNQECHNDEVRCDGIELVSYVDAC